jgi:hypothetical protein
MTVRFLGALGSISVQVGWRRDYRLLEAGVREVSSGHRAGDAGGPAWVAGNQGRISFTQLLRRPTRREP